MKTWLPLIEYSVQTGLSLSTLRRYIKAKKLEYRIENGKYWIACSDSLGGSETRLGTNSGAALNELLKAREEIAELKTLIAFYEEHQPVPQNNPRA